MKTIPMLFSAPMVKALLDGRKTQTRRTIKFPVEFCDNTGFNFQDKHGKWWACGIGFSVESTSRNFIQGKSPYQVDDLIWVRETFRLFDATDECDHFEHPCPCPATGEPIYRATQDDGESTWKPSIFMPRWASRITLKVTNVRAERLQDISEADAKAEGCNHSTSEDAIGAGWYEKPRRAFWRLWEQINGAGSWDANPFVWVIEFEVINKNIDAYLRDHGGDYMCEVYK